MEIPHNVDKNAVVKTLNHIMEMELAGVVRYTHYSLMVFGHSRIPIVGWLREQATEAMAHAQQAGELLTAFGEHPSLGIGPLLETHNHDINTILVESLEHERSALKLYYELLELTEGTVVVLEEYARQMIYQEELHAAEVDKMLRRPGEIQKFSSE